MKKPKLLIFDVDGTIVDSFRHGYENARQFIKGKTGEEISEDEYRELIKENPWEQILARAGLQAEEKMDVHSMPGFIAPYENQQLFDGMKAALERLCKVYPMVIITSTFISMVLTRFEQEGIDTYFSAFLGPEVSIHKDAKIKLILEEYQIEPEQVVFIGDTVSDMKEAKKAGVKTIGVTWGFNTPEQMRDIQPDYLASNVKELESLLL